jgi:hypothetical protein
MNILETMLSGGGGGMVNQLAGQFGISPAQATAVTSTLLPALAGGLQERLSGGNASAITDLISSGKLTSYADHSDSLASPSALDHGRTMLSHIFGSGDTGNMVSMVAEKAGLSSGVVDSMLPVAAAMLGGFLSKKVASGDSLTDSAGQLANAGHSGFMDTVRGLVSHFRA